MKLLFIHNINDSVNAPEHLWGPLPGLPEMERTNAADAADAVCDHIHDIGLPERNKILMDLIADAVKDR